MSYQGPQRGLVKNDQASMVTRNDVPRSKYITRQVVNTTFDQGFLVPFIVDEVLPGDHLKYNVSAFVRMATPLFPLFSSMNVDTFLFFVPNRLVWATWARFMGEYAPDVVLDDDSMPTVFCEAGGFAELNLGDYFGLPVQGQLNTGVSISVNALPFRAYSLIWNEWFREQNTQAKLTYLTDSTPQGEAAFDLQRRNKLHDYFTTCLPYPQRFTSPTVPLSGDARIKGLGFVNSGGTTGPITVNETDGITDTYAFYQSTANLTPIAKYTGLTGSFPEIYADLESAAGMRIEDLRYAMAVQGLYEKDSRGGTRYIEQIYAHFGVTNPDFRLQRPEYIGGGSSPLQITPVAQTAVGGGTTVGALGAAATGIGMHDASYAATEHGFVIGLINVQADLMYQQGLHKKWARNTRLDYYFPSLAHLGEQAVLQKEIYVKGSIDDSAVFGYQERFAEYRRVESFVSGRFRSEVAGTLDAWHLGQRFVSAPTLDLAFMIDNAPMSRILAAGTESEGQQFLANILIDRTFTRPLPMFGTPATLGRF